MMIVLDVALLVVLNRGLTRPDGIDLGVVPALLGAFAFVEWRVVHVQFRAEASSFSLFEIPLVLGLLYASPVHLPVVTIVGVALGLLAGRRQPPLKLVFNAINLGLYAGIAAVVVDRSQLVGHDRLTWLTVLIGVVLGSAASFGLIIAAVTLTEGFPGWRRTSQLLGFTVVVSVTNTTIGLTAAIILAEDILGLLLLAVPAFLLFRAFRLITSEREQRERIEFLYRSTRRLDVGASETGLVTLLREAREMFRAEIGAVVLREDNKIRFVRSAGTEELASTSTDPRDVQRLAWALATVEEPEMTSAEDRGPLAELVAGLGGRDAMTAKLRAEDRDLGIVIIANRLGKVTSFTANDLQVLGALARQSAILMHSDRLEQALTDLRELEQRLAYQASHDSLTGLPNRSMFTEVLHLTANSAKSHALLFVDLDGFKTVNDSHGHAAGDAVLVEVGERLRRLVRPSDTVSRFGGDEFAVLLVDTDQPEIVAERIITKLAEPLPIPGGEAKIGCSIGLAVGGADGDPETLLRDADAAMYRAKQSGKGTLVSHHTGPVGRKSVPTGALEKAIRLDELELLYQPIVDTARRTIPGVEALVRWRHPDRGLLLPGDFLSEAERCGLIGEIDRWVLRQAADELAGIWAVEPDLFVSVNLAPRHLIDGSIAELVALDELDNARGRLVIEWPEQVLVGVSDRSENTLAALRETGVRIALDRFGDGEASLAYLQRFDLDLVKLGRRLADRLVGADQNLALVKAIVDVAHALGLDVVIDGVEHQAQLEALTSTACDMAQGFLFAGPMQLAELELLITRLAPPAVPRQVTTTRLT